MMPMPPAITVTPAAMAKIEAVRSKSGHPDACLRIAIAGRRGGQFVYELDLVAPEDAPSGDLTVQAAGFRVLVEPGSAANLEGAVIDLDASALGGALRIDNPNEGWRDPVAARIQEVLDRQINPSVAAHGGFVDLLEVRGHAGLAGTRLAGKCPRHLVRQMVVAQGHDITIAEGDDGHLGRRPGTDAGQRREQAARLRRFYARHRFEPAGLRRGTLND